MPTPDPNAMDTHADRSQSYSKFQNRKQTQGRVSTTKEDPDIQRKEGAVSPATNKVTWPEIVQTNLPINERPRHKQPRLQTVIMKQSLKLQTKIWIPLDIFG
jgi:hypothetical protein